MKYLIPFALLLISLNIRSSPTGECGGTPDKAVVELPAPLSNWGQILCTPYGYIITNKEGWIWSNPDSYSPVMIPSQMVRTKPEPLGNKSYFTKIEMVALNEEKAKAAIKIFESGFDKSETAPKVYSLSVSSIFGKALDFNFFDYGDSQWGMWCNKGCDPSSKFMLLNMPKKPST